MAETEFDVFLSHNSSDKPLVRVLKRLLAEAGLKAWLDEDELRPGINWQPLLEAGVRSSKSIAVLIGPDGVGPWEQEEMEGALQLAVRYKQPIIPTLLPGCQKRPELPSLFLGNRTWVDLSGGYTDACIAKLIWGITGKKPDSSSEPPKKVPTTPAELWSERWTARGHGTRDCYDRLHTICAGGEVPKGDDRKALWAAVKRNRPASFLDWQLANLARWSAPEYLDVEERFTPLQVNVRVRESEERPAEKQQLHFDTLAKAMHAVFDEHMAPASVIFAQPGGGKSTLLRHYQLTQAQHLADSERLVFYVQLRDYRPAKAPTNVDSDLDNTALVWLEDEWRKETGNAPSLREFIRQGTLTLLLDGLNEIPRRSDEEYHARVGEWRELIEAIDRSHPGVRLLFACRPMDYSERLDAGRHTRLPEIEVQAMEPERIAAFIHKRFDRTIATEIWNQLENNPSLELYSSPYYLNLLLGQIDTEELVIPQNRADLFSGMVRERLRRECQNKKNPRFDDTERLGKHDRRTIVNDKSRGNWLPDDTPLFSALAALAFHIQDASGSNDRWGSLPRNKARKAMKRALDRTPPADAVLEAGCDLGLFEDDAAQAGDIRFIHQQMQEYFAAWVLAELADLERLAVPWRSADLAEFSTEALLARGGDDDLPELFTTGWDESALIAANLSDEPERFIRELATHNLPLAGRCAAQAGVEISADLLQELRDLLRKRTVHSEADLRARILAGKALGELGDPERLTEYTHGKGTKYLLPCFAEIPAGNYRIGGDSKRRSFESSEPLTVSLERFELALHSVTNAEFAAFVKDDGYRNDAWWPDRALEWRKGLIGQESTQKRVREDRQTILKALGNTATVEEIRDHYKFSLTQAKWWKERIGVSEEVFDAWLPQAYPPPAGPFLKPRYWRSLTWSNPAQPVVGICWYEARAYCLWLNAVLENDRYRLPSEAEWEAAGRSRGEWRRYAWPGEFDPLRANTAETRLAVTTPVGVFPSGATEDTGLLDLCGNVWEWTATPWSEPDHWVPTAHEHDDEADGRRVVRGGSWNDTQGNAGLGCRRYSVPDDRAADLGFRLCRASPI